eukprot:TRINITY_DN10291_c0_g1_i1.p1 TRINITY_DN10291_c0_g1~~TRINITY_DN10291_c0_g1_i1.p1  ORF type:complete len:1000 (+),score=141.00 TRINITY_DN10291_c0_g1_i1:1164-4163(+)
MQGFDYTCPLWRRWPPQMVEALVLLTLIRHVFCSDIVPHAEVPMNDKRMQGEKLMMDFGTRNKEDIIKYITFSMARDLWFAPGDAAATTIGASLIFQERIMDMWKPVYTGALFTSARFHRSTQHVPIAAFLEKRRRVILELKRIWSHDDMRQIIQAAGFALSDRPQSASGSPGISRPSLTVEEGFEAVADTLSIAAQTIRMTMHIIRRVRRDPCRLLPLWSQSAERFVIEHARLYSPVGGFRANLQKNSNYSSRVQSSAGEAADPEASLKHHASGHYYNLQSANLDETAFPNPWTFDPGSYLSKVVAWNALERDVHAGGNTTARRCPGREFAIRFAIQTASKFFPKGVECHGDNRVHHGVAFESSKHSVGSFLREGESDVLEVLKVVPGSANKKELFLFVHGFPGAPQQWAGLIAKLRSSNHAYADFWSVALPGWGHSSPASSCGIARAADSLSKFVLLHAVAFTSIYLIGHDVGGFLAWKAADTLGDRLAGLVVFAPHPAAYRLKVASWPKGERPYLWQNLSPLLGSIYLAADEFDKFEESLPWSNESWWVDARDDHLKYWMQTGAHQMSCYYQDNFDVDGATGSMQLKDGSSLATIDPSSHVLMVSAERERWLWGPRDFMAGASALTGRTGRILQWREVKEAGHVSLLFDEPPLAELANHIENFVDASRRARLSLAGILRIHGPAFHPTEAGEVGREDLAIVIALSFLVFSILAGLSLELHLGPLLVALPKSQRQLLWRLAQITSVPMIAAAYASGSKLGIPVWTAGLWKMGFPEGTSTFKLSLISDRDESVSPLTQAVFRASQFASALGTLVHHSGATLFYCAALVGLEHVTTGVIMIVPLAGQHLAAFIQQKTAYCLVLLALEVWFQLEAYAAWPLCESLLSRVGIALVLAAHYTWIATQLVELCVNGAQARADRRAGRSEEEPPTSPIHALCRGKAASAFTDMLDDDAFSSTTERVSSRRQSLSSLASAGTDHVLAESSTMTSKCASDIESIGI